MEASVKGIFVNPLAVRPFKFQLQNKILAPFNVDQCTDRAKPHIFPIPLLLCKEKNESTENSKLSKSKNSRKELGCKNLSLENEVFC